MATKPSIRNDVQLLLWKVAEGVSTKYSYGGKEPCAIDLEQSVVQLTEDDPGMWEALWDRIASLGNGSVHAGTALLLRGSSAALSEATDVGMSRVLSGMFNDASNVCGKRFGVVTSEDGKWHLELVDAERMSKREEQEQKLRARLAAEYSKAHKEMLAERTSFLTRANEYLAPRLWARIQQRLLDNPPTDPQAKEEFKDEINGELDQLGLGLVCPITKRVAHLRAPSSGEFHLVPHGNKSPTINRTDVREFFSQLTKRHPLQFALAVSSKAAHVAGSKNAGPSAGAKIHHSN